MVEISYEAPSTLFALPGHGICYKQLSHEVSCTIRYYDLLYHTSIDNSSSNLTAHRTFRWFIIRYGYTHWLLLGAAVKNFMTSIR